VATSAGILGRVNKVSGNYVTLQIAENVQVTLQKSAVQTLLPKGTINSVEKE
jgi:preprotein translocase subunit YajC